MKHRPWIWGMVAILLVAAALRLYAFGEIPPGLYHDEAQHGIDAIAVLESGYIPLYFTANNGREPLFIYLDTLAVGVLGRSPLALRIPSFFIGVLTVAATAAMGRALFSRWVGLLASAVLSITLWHVHLSRTAYRAVLLPLFIGLIFWLVARALKTSSLKYWIPAGFLYGLSFYTYTAARFTVVALICLGLYTVCLQRERRRNLPWRETILALAAALVAIAPLAMYTLLHLETVLGRPGQVSITSPEINGGDFWGTLCRHTIRTLGMFFVKGDRIWRHNVPSRPVFDPVMGLMSLVGLWLLIRRVRQRPVAGVVLIWVLVMMMPTLFAEDAPHFLRAIGVMPVVALVPAVGIDGLRRCARPRWLRSIVMIFPLLFGVSSTVWDYFGRYADAPMTAYWFEQGAVTLAGRVNSFLESGWDGEQMLRGESHDREVFLDSRLWSDWPQLQFLIADTQTVAIGLDNERGSDSVAVFAWPYEDWQRAWTLLPTAAEITVERGALSRGDADPEPYTTYLAFYGTHVGATSQAIARFDGGIELLGASVVPVDDNMVRVRIRWRATSDLTEDYTVFLHYLRDGERISQADSGAAYGYYPTSQWHAGDIINDDHDVSGVDGSFPGHDRLRLGLWDPESGSAIHLLDESGKPVADWIEVAAE